MGYQIKVLTEQEKTGITKLLISYGYTISGVGGENVPCWINVDDTLQHYSVDQRFDTELMSRTYKDLKNHLYGVYGEPELVELPKETETKPTISGKDIRDAISWALAHVEVRNTNIEHAHKVDYIYKHFITKEIPGPIIGISTMEDDDIELPF